MSGPRIALIHATPLAIAPIRDAFGAGWPAADTVNLLDDALSVDRAAGGARAEGTVARILALGHYAEGLGADGILYSCSAFGAAIDAMKAEARVPVLKPNEAMFEAALTRGGRIGMVATFAPSIPSMRAEFEAQAGEMGAGAGLDCVLAEGAMEALARGEAAEHDARVAEAAARLGDADVIMLAQFSMARALEAVKARVRSPVLTSPASAVAKMRRLVG